MRNKWKFLAITTLLTILTILIKPAPIGSSSATTLGFQPKSLVSIIDTTFIVNITISSVTNLNCWQISMSFSPKILSCMNLSIPTENIFYGYNIFFPTPVINNTSGQIIAFCAIEGTEGVSGSGILCSIKFESKNLGVSTLNFRNLMMLQLDGTYLQDPNSNLIPFETTIDVIQVITQGFIENVFNITYNSETLQVTILSNSTITNFNFNSTTKALTYDATGQDNTKGASIVTIPNKIMNQTLIALADNIPLKTFISTLNTLPENGTHSFTYFTYTHSTHNIKIIQTITGDITGDRKVDIKDVATASKSFGTTPASPNWKPIADINQDYKIDIKDISLISKNFGQYLAP